MGTVILMGMNNLIQKNIYSSEKKKEKRNSYSLYNGIHFSKTLILLFYFIFILKKKKTKN
jgi:hypothetical protein